MAASATTPPAYKKIVIAPTPGDKLSGVLQDATVQLKLSSGGEAEVSKDKIKEIQIRRLADGNKKQE